MAPVSKAESGHTAGYPNRIVREHAPVDMRPVLRRQSLQFAALFCALLFGLSLLLVAWRIEQMLSDLSQERTGHMVRQLDEGAEGAMRLGLAAADLSFLDAQLRDMLQRDPSLRAAFVDTRSGDAIAQAGNKALRKLVEPRWTERLVAETQPYDARGGSGAQHLAERPTSIRSVPGYVLTGSVMFDPTGAPAATLWAVVDPSIPRQEARAAAQTIFLQALPAVALTFAVLSWALFAWSRYSASRFLPHACMAASAKLPRGTWLVGGLLSAALLTAPLGMVWAAREAARPYVTEQIEANATLVASAAANEIERALNLGVPLARLAGLGALFQDRLASAPEISSLSLVDGDGSLLEGTKQQLASPAPRDNASQERELSSKAAVGSSGARVVAGYAPDYVDRALGAMLIDLILALVISAVLLRELTRGLWRRSLMHPLLDHDIARAWQSLDRRLPRRKSTTADPTESRDTATVQRTGQRVQRALHTQRSDVSDLTAPPDNLFAPQLTRLRLAVFLIALSDELLRPFFTVFASEMQTPGSTLSPAFVAGLPVAAFMLTLALAQPLGPYVVRHFDLRKCLILAAAAGAGALMLTAFAHHSAALVALRAVSGACYGLGLILVQTAIVRGTTRAQRARGLAEVAAAIVAAGIVGPPFGGMIAGRVGDGYAILACAFCMACACGALWRLRLPGTHGPGIAQSAALPASSGGWRGYAAVLSNPRAMCVILGSAVPARLVAVTVLVVVVPLYMSEIDQPASIAGRVMLLYFLCFAATASLMAHWSDVLSRRRPFIVAGCLMAASGCLLLPVIGGVAGMAVCCALLGVGQATQSSAQIASVTEVFEHAPLSARSATPEQSLAAFRLIERIGSVAAPFATALAVALLGLAGAVAATGALLAVAAIGIWILLREDDLPGYPATTA